MLEGFFDLGGGLGGRVAGFGEEVAVVVGLVGSVAVAGHAGDLTLWGVFVRRWGLVGAGARWVAAWGLSCGGREQERRISWRREGHGLGHAECAYQSVRVPSSFRAMGR